MNKRELEISNSIIERLRNDKSKNVVQPTLGRGEIQYVGDEHEIYWIVRNEIQSSSKKIRNIHDDVIGVKSGGQLDVLPDSNGETVISRDSKLCEFLIKKQIGNFSYKINEKEFNFDVFSTSFYEPLLLPEPDALNGYLLTEDNLLDFKSLIKERKLELLIEDLEKKLVLAPTESEKDELVRRIKESENKLKEIRELKERKKRHIIKSSMLRDQPVLDVLQESIKRSKIFDGSLIITGGPGTGKTTSLIQRINFLISGTISDYIPKLSDKELQLITDRSNSWLFFSPSNLLKQYLKNVLSKENLSPDDDKVLIWEVHRRKLFRYFGLINPEKQRPFLAIQNDDQFFKLDGVSLNNMLADFEKIFVEFQKNKIEKILNSVKENEIDLSFMENIISELKNYENISSLKDFINFYDNLNYSYSDTIKNIITETNEILDKLTAECLILIKQNADIENEIKNYIENSIKENFEQLETEPDDLFEDEDDEGEENFSEILESEMTIRSNRLVKRLIQNYSLSLVNKSTRLSKPDKEILERIKDIFDLEKTKTISIGLFIRKYFNKILKGFEANILRELPNVYKKFRKEKVVNYDFVTFEGKELLLKSIKDRNIRIHKEEMDFILLSIFRLIHGLFNSNRKLYNDSKDIYIDQFKYNSKIVIAIDEATDFSILELACMSYLSNPKYRCVTLCGDLMQRLESKGIKDWDDYTNIFTDSQIGNLEISYRQTPDLLSIGKELYKNNTGKDLIIEAAYPKDKDDPYPLIFQSDSISDKIEWLSERIYSIHSIYENKLPSIAVFFNNDDTAKFYESELNKCDKLSDNDIKIVNCPDGKILGEAENVRLFNIKYIKGLEFEAVFFIDIDEMTSKDDVLDRLIYVGISRASFYLGITVKKELPERLNYLNEYFHEKSNWS